MMKAILVDQELLGFFKAMADQSRLVILGLLARGEQNVQDIAASIGLKEPTVSHHLKILREAGLVRLRTEGTTHWYSYEPKTLTDTAHRMLDRDEIMRLGDRAVGIDADYRMAANFLRPDITLTEIPAQRKKRRAVLVFIVRRLDPDHRYRESELDDVLQRFHPDFATLRREFIGYRMMAREKNIYWRLSESEWRDDPKGLRGPGR